MTWLRQAPLGAAFLLGLTLLQWAQHQRTAQLSAALADSRNVAEQHKTTSQALRDQLQHERQTQSQLRQQQNALRTSLAARQQLIKELTHANAELRDWTAQPLPDPARRLRQRPALIGADAYHQWLSGRDPLPTTGDPPAQ